MNEKMSWKGDEKLYQPRIHSERIRELHQIGEETGLPMTVILDLAIRVLTEEYNNNAALPEIRPGI